MLDNSKHYGLLFDMIGMPQNRLDFTHERWLKFNSGAKSTQGAVMQEQEVVDPGDIVDISMSQVAENDDDLIPQLPVDVKANPVINMQKCEEMRSAFDKDFEQAFAEQAAKSFHWYNSDKKSWLQQTQSGKWQGWRCIDIGPISLEQWTPWEQILDHDHIPCFKWFKGALTNSAFNEVDRHVLGGQGNEAAFIFEGEEWDASAYGGLGRPVHEGTISRKELLMQSVLAAVALKELGLKVGDRIALFLPNIVDQVIWIEGAKRLGVIYTSIYSELSAKTLADRIEQLGAKIVITSNGALKNGQIRKLKDSVVDLALDKFVSSKKVIEIVDYLAKEHCDSVIANEIIMRVIDALRGELTTTPGVVLHEVGDVLIEQGGLDAINSINFRTALLNKIREISVVTQSVIVIDNACTEAVKWNQCENRDYSAAVLLEQAMNMVCNKLGLEQYQELEKMAGPELVAALWDVCPCEPLPASFPLFIAYSSGLTGKPKPIVHTHSSITMGVNNSVNVCFDAKPGRDVIYVTADPGGIVGQSYLISASLLNRITGVMVEGAHIYPDAGRFASVIYRRQVTILITKASLIQSFMLDTEKQRLIESYDLSSLRIASFSAEPINPKIHRFAMELLTPNFINSYISSESGTIIWSHFYGNADYRLKSNGAAFILPWVSAQIRIPSINKNNENRFKYRLAETNEWGELVIERPLPTMMLTIWGDGDNVTDSNWAGDIHALNSHYYSRYCDQSDNPDGAFILGDYACINDDHSYLFHDYYDDSINISGNVFAASDIENAIRRDKFINSDSPVDDCIVIAAPDTHKVNIPLAFIKIKTGTRLSKLDVDRINSFIESEMGTLAIPDTYIVVDQFPETQNGKYLRRIFIDLIYGNSGFDKSGVINPVSVDKLHEKICKWRSKSHKSSSNLMVRKERFVSAEYFSVTSKSGKEAFLVTLIIDAKPVNALSNEVLDDLIKIVGDLEQDVKVKAIVIGSKNPKCFVAGADIRQIFKQIKDRDTARAFATKGHVLFSRIEQMKKPVIAAISGLALGGGCELAMSCHFRVADRSAIFAQPEINLFIPPGFGGTQRVPRVIVTKSNSLERALNDSLYLLLSGRQVDADRAESLGLVDCLTGGIDDALTHAHTLAISAIKGEDATVADAMIRRHEDVASWSHPVPVPWSAIMEHAEIQRCLRQSVSVGRGKVANAIVKLVQIGFQQGFEVGLAAEAEAFSLAVIDQEHGGMKGLDLFFSKKSPPLPTQYRPQFSDNEQNNLVKEGRLLKIGAPFYPGKTPLPEWQYAYAVVKDLETGEALHGEPIRAEKQVIVPVPEPRSHQALLYVLGSEINRDDISALSGFPESVFNMHDKDVHITGSGGVGLVVGLGEELMLTGRLKIGDVVAIYPGVINFLSPEAVTEPMGAGFHSQGMDSPDGSHQQFITIDGPQCIKPPQKVPFELVGSYLLPAGTVYRTLFTALKVKPRKRILIEGASSASGSWAAKLATAHRMKVTGMVPTKERVAVGEKNNIPIISRDDLTTQDCFTRVPEDPAEWRRWLHWGESFLEKIRDKNDGNLMDYVISHAGEEVFPRSFQALVPGGTIAFHNATTGYNMTFVGKPGRVSALEMLNRADIIPGDSVVVYYGDGKTIQDITGLETIEILRESGARVVVITETREQCSYVNSMGFGESIVGIFSLENLAIENQDFQWFSGMPVLPDPMINANKFRDGIRQFTSKTYLPVAKKVGSFFGDSKFKVDVVIERAHKDSLAVSSMLVKPLTGRVIYLGDMGGKRYSFYAPQVSIQQRTIIMPSATIIGTNLCNVNELNALNRMIDAGWVDFPEVYLAPWEQAPGLHQSIMDNNLSKTVRNAVKTVLNHALPAKNISTVEELLLNWFNESKQKEEQ
ncbi:MAG: acetyl-CoA synthetase [Gammaproteobacteria bacterium]|nr:MAG: acetyl-CoA synthetase [Gammaproteobacteria bacterium]